MRIKYFAAIITAALFVSSCGDSAIYTAQKFVPNNGPVIENIECILPSGVSADSISNGMVIRIIVSARDPEGKPLDYSFASESGIFANIVKSDTGCSAELRTENINGNGSVYITVNAEDEKGASDTRANIKVGTGRSGPSVGITANPRNYMKPSADTGISFSCTVEGYYQVRCDNTATSDTIGINYDDPVYMYVPSGDPDNPKIVNISIAGLTSTTSGRVKLPDDNAPNKVWIIFWDGLKQFDIKCFVINQDSIPPVLRSITPTGEEKGVKSDVRLEFNETVTMSGGLVIKDSSNNDVSSRFSAPSVSDYSIVMTSQDDLDYYEIYSVSRNTSFMNKTVIEDLAGNECIDDINAIFTTQAAGVLTAPVFINGEGVDPSVTDKTVFNYELSRTVTVKYDGGVDGVNLAYNAIIGETTIDTNSTTGSSIDISFDKNTVITATVSKKGYKPVSSTKNVYIRTATPVITPAGTNSGDFYAGVYNSLNVSINSTGAVTYSYTTDGSLPGDPLTGYSLRTFNDHDQRIRYKARAVVAHMEPSDIAEGGEWRVRHKIPSVSEWENAEPPIGAGYLYGTLNYKCLDADSTGQYIAAAAENGYIYTSVDYGETWTEQTNSGQRDWRGISISDSQSGTLKIAAAAYNDRIYTSNSFYVAGAECDWGAKYLEDKWVSLAGSRNGTRIFAAAKDGKISYSMDSGGVWNNIGIISSWNQVICSSEGDKFFAIADNTQDLYSGVYGTVWTFSSFSAGVTRNWLCVAGNKNFDYFALSARDTSSENFYLYTFNNNSLQTVIGPVGSAAKIRSFSYAYDSYTLRDKFFGSSSVYSNYYNYQNVNSWEHRAFVSNFNSNYLYENGNKIFGARDYVYKGEIDASFNWTFAAITSSGSRNWKEIVSSLNGQHIYAVAMEGGATPYYIYYSSDRGQSFSKLVAVGGSSTPYTIDCSADGSILFVASRIVRKFNEYGANYLPGESYTTAIASDYTSVACNADGSRGYIFAGDFYFYTYNQSNSTRYEKRMVAYYKYLKVKCAKISDYYLCTVYNNSNSTYGWRLSCGWGSGLAYHYDQNNESADYKDYSISADGSTLAFIGSDNRIIRYKKNGTVYDESQIQDGTMGKSAVSMSADGTIIYYTRYPGSIYVSYDSGIKFDEMYPARIFWSCITSPDNGMNIIAGATGKRGLLVME